MKSIIGLLIVGFFICGVSDSTKVDTIKVEQKNRDYSPIHRKIENQNIRLDSIILLLKNDTIKIQQL